MSELYDDLDELPAPPRKDIPAADRELLELAARAIGARFEEVDGEGYGNLRFEDGSVVNAWNPRRFSGDSLELAVDLGLDVYPVARTVSGQACIAVGAVGYGRLAEVIDDGGDRRDATRLAILRAAAEISKAIS